jgi:fumarate reductase flavoprotein subunit
MDADVIVVGAGFAGLTLAARAGELGLKAIVLEQGDGEDYPCNSRYSGGMLHLGMDDPAANQDYLIALIERLTHDLPGRAFTEAFTAEAPKALAWVRSHGAQFIRLGSHPGRQWVMAPPRRGQPGLDWKGRGPDAILRRLAAATRASGGEIRMKSRGIRLIIDGGTCVGLEVESGGSRSELHGRAVAIADGGFQANSDLVRRFVSPHPDKIMQRNARTGCGDGLLMAEAVGARLVGMEAFYGHPLARGAFTNDLLWPHPYLDSMVVSGIVVADDGQRFVNEGQGPIFLANTLAKRADPLDATVIFDDAIWNGPAADKISPPAPNPTLKIAKARIHKALTVKELAVLADLPVDALCATVAQYNEALSRGTLGSMSVVRSSNIYKPMPIAKPPYYAVPMCAGITYTMGGPLVDADARVLHRDGHVIDGLFAVGSATGGLEGGPDVGYIGGLVKAFTLGRLAAQFIAAATVKPAS